MKHFISFSSGRELEIDKGTFDEISRRIATGKQAGWYTIKHGPSIGCSINFNTIASVEVQMTEKERRDIEAKAAAAKAARVNAIKNQDVETGQRIVGSFEHDPRTCPVDHTGMGTNKPANIEVRVLTTEQGTKQYFPICTMCGWRGKLVKPASLENTYGIEPDNVKPYEG